VNQVFLSSASHSVSKLEVLCLQQVAMKQGGQRFVGTHRLETTCIDTCHNFVD
jgi:hypothetical protein